MRCGHGASVSREYRERSLLSRSRKNSMRAMVLPRPGARKVTAVDRDVATPGPSEISVRVLACGVCRTDLHVIDGDLPDPAIPVVPGHEIVGCVEQVGDQVKTFAPGERVGIPWLGWSCGECEF